MFGKLAPLPKEEYLKIYEDTGIDIDGRQEYLATVLLPNMEKSLALYVAFLKGLPCFNSLPIDDQVALMKGMQFPTLQLRRCANY